MMKRMQALITLPVTLLFVVYLYMLVKIILFKFGEVNFMFLWRQAEAAITDNSRLRVGLYGANFTPFHTIAGNLHSGALYEYIQLYGNIGLFIPFGMFMAYLVRGKRFGFVTYGAVLVSSFVLCLLLEGIQLLCTIGTFDVDDLILNTAGGVLGCMLFHLLSLTAKTAPKPAAALGSSISQSTVS
ncbi:VanZ family protein [Paenibacillus kobensis]|uniref:VanZ family protein n=1 Tax=Paenibacillus kobensis TaxID=59841 RepID=UPI000FD9E007|nr:VanZ family protein [Paenibacillus kobensis]